MKRLLAMLLAIVMVLSLFPVTALMAFAEEETLVLEEVVETAEAPEEETDPAEEPAEETTEAPAEEAAEEPTEEPAKKNTEAVSSDCGYEGTHTAATVNGLDCSVAEDGSLIVCACNFPDDAFRAYIAENIDADSNGCLSAGELAVTEMHCYQMGIASLQGIGYFADLTYLGCSFNALTELDLSNNTALTYLACNNNALSVLDVSANTELSELYCSNNALTELDLSNNTALTYLNCSANDLGTLDLSANTALSCLKCSYNALRELDLSANTELSELNCCDNDLTALDVSGSTALDTLNFSGNALTALDLSNNTALTYLDCANNALTALDLSANTDLVYLYCNNNALTALDLSNNTALTDLYCFGNALRALDLSDNTALKTLYCYNNALTALDLSANTKLSALYCFGNDLTALDLSNNTALNWLQCTNNDLTELDVSDNTELYYLDCSGNALTALDLSNNTALTELHCFGNALTALDLSANTALVVLDCYNNALTELDLSANTALASLDCHNNALTALDVSGNTDLSYLDCSGNALTELDLSNNTALSYLDCDSQYWYGELPVTANEDGTYTADLNSITDATRLSSIYADNWSIDLNDGTVTLDYDPNETGFTYVYATGWGDSVMTVNVNVTPSDGDGDEGGDEGDDYYGADFSDIAPALEDMTVLTLDTDFTATIEESYGYAWFTFTPTESGTYSFYSSRDGYDPYGYLLNADLKELTHNDDGAGNLNFSIVYELEAGQTYVLAAKLLGDNIGSYTVRVGKAKVVTGISVKPISIPEGANCWYENVTTEEGGVEFIPYYSWPTMMETTLTFSDGSTATGKGNPVIANGVSYELATYDDQEYGVTGWEVGNTYDVMVSCGDVETETTVKITSSKIKSVTVSDITILENTNGVWYGEDEDEVDWFYYDWEDCLRWTVTFKDGTKKSGTSSYFEYGDYVYAFNWYDDQSEADPWEAGGTYTGNIMIGGISKQINVSIRGTTEELAQVQNLKVTGTGATSIKIAYDAVENAGRYEIYVDGNYWGNTTKTTYTISGLTTGYGYYITVAAAQKVDGVWCCGPVSDSVWGRAYRDISDYYVKLEYTSTVYDGTVKYPEVTLKKSSSGKTIASENYYCDYVSNVEVGQGFVAIMGVGEYGGVIYKEFDILPQQVTGVEVTDITSDSVTITFDPVYGATEYWVYRGSTRVAKITDTTYTYTGLKAGTTYKFSVRANAVQEVYDLENFDPYEDYMPDIIEAEFTGKASATVSAKPVYRMEDCTAEPKALVKQYTGKKVTNTFTVKNADGKSLKKDTDYTVSYENNKEMGYATAILKGKGKYAGELRVTFAIGPKAVKNVEVEVIDGTTLQASWDTLKGAVGYIIFVDGEPYDSAAANECVISDLTAGQKYTVTVRAVVALDNGDAVLGVESKAVTATPRHNLLDFITGAYVYFDDGEFWTCNYTGKKITPAVDVWVNHGNGQEMLTYGEDFTVEYKNNKNVGEATFTIKGIGAYSGSMNTQKFYIIPAAVTNLKLKTSTDTSVTLSWTKTKSAGYYEIYMDGSYVGKTTSSSYKIKNLVAGEEHEFSVVSCKKVSKKLGDFASEWTSITARAGKFIGDMNISLDSTTLVYTGEPLMPTVTVKTSSKSSATTLVEGVDYELWYYYNADPAMAFGKQTVTVTGIGAYTGTVTKTFTVVPPTVSNVQAEATGKKSISVTFDTPLEDYLEDYMENVEYWVYVDGSRKAKVTEGNCEITGLKAGKTYKITVKAVVKVDGENYTSDSTDAVKVTTLK